MSFFLYCLMTIIYLPLLTKQSASNYQRMIVIGEQQLKINYNSTSDTIPFQKTINLTSDQANSIEKSTISFWFKPTVYSNSSLFRRRRNLENVYLDKTNTILKYQGVSYSITEINYNQTSLDSYETFNSYLKNYTNSFIFNILCTLDSGAFTNMIGMSYRNSNGFYGISFQTNNKSFDIILSSLSSAIFASNWCFISIGLDYTSNALMQVTIVQKEVVIIAKIPIESPSKFYNPSMNLGSLTKQPTEFLKNTVCNCAVSSFIWDLDIFTLNETLDLRRTIMSPIFYGDFNESTENLLSLSPATNNFVDNYEGEGAKKPEFLLGDNSKNYTNPYLDRTIMGLKFQENNVALFKTNIYSTFGSIIDFTMSFWIRVDFFDGSKKIILTNENYKDYEVFMIISQFNGSENILKYTVRNQEIASFPIEKGEWYFFLTSIFNYFTSDVLHITALLYSRAIQPKSNVATVLDSSDSLKEILFIYFQNILFGINFNGILKSFRYYRGSYQSPRVSLSNCTIPIIAPKTHFIKDNTTLNLILPNTECLICNNGFSWDNTKVACSENKNPCSENQQDFRVLIGKCEDCYSYCKFPVCGNGIIEGFETCDDGLTLSGCSTDCLSSKNGWDCSLSKNLTQSVCTSKCNDKCTNCVQNGTIWVCQECMMPYLLYGNQCLYNCPENYYSSEGDPKTCELCKIPNCSNCSFKSNQCSKCFNGFYLDLVYFGCYSTPPSDYFLAHPNNFSIRPCNHTLGYCQKCQNETVCQECTAGKLLTIDFKVICADECPEKYHLNNFDKKCEKCTIQNCSNSTDNNIADNDIIKSCNDSLSNCYECDNGTECLICFKDFFLLSNKTCVEKCPIDYYRNSTTEECQVCSSNCTICNEGNCLSCAKNYYNINNTCLLCSEIKGFQLNCTEICGDGLLFNKERSGHQCDDGNNNNGDGCDSNCKIETNFNCTRKNQYTPDFCFDVKPVQLQFIARPDSPNIIQISSSKKLKNINMLMSFINAEIPLLNASDYSFESSVIGNNIILKILYKVSIKSVYIEIKLMKPSKSNISQNNSKILEEINENISDITDENNVSIEDQYFNKTTTISLYPFEYLSNEQRESVEKLKLYQKNIMTAVAISGGLSIFESFNIFWLMVDAMQIANFFLYINVLYPSNLQTYLTILSTANLNFIPDPFSLGTSDDDNKKKKWKILGKEIEEQKAPLRFETLGITSLFLKNAGLQFVILILLWLIYGLVLICDFFIKRIKLLRTWTMHLQNCREKLEFSCLIQVHLLVFFEFSLGCFLQIINISIKSAVNFSSSILSLLAFIYITFFLMKIFALVNKNKREVLEDAVFKLKYDILFDDYKKETFLQRNYPALVLLKKYLMVLFLVMFHDYPLVELLSILVIFLSHLAILIIGMPFKRKLTNMIMIIGEIIFITIIGLVLHIFVLDSMSDGKITVSNEVTQEKVDFGWAVIGLISFNLGMYLLVFFREQVLNLLEFCTYLKESKNKYKKFLTDLFKKKMLSKPILRDLSIYECEIVEDPYKIIPGSIIDKKNLTVENLGCEMVKDPNKKISEEKIDKIFLNVENLPVISFYEYFKKFKAKNATKTELPVKMNSNEILKTNLEDVKTENDD